MSSSCRSASPFSSTSSRPNLHYEPAIYCRCGLKAPLCHLRDSGQKFFGCQKYKDGGCGFFVWKEDILATVEVLNDGSTQSVHELKSLILELKDEIKHLRRDLEVQSVERKDLKKIWVFVILIVIGIYLLSNFQHKSVNFEYVPMLK
ncbi:uncharacterized protein LOC116028441 [Ipomoea triloba]|uniref:uncharacterized protein LOC116028441 n=1 Tax=Ipomoea triloba TaxID=35885 RepID=UPI00125D29CA|nr:uncharacterized protein LOC116028441 [Ipomoea triloba]